MKKILVLFLSTLFVMGFSQVGLSQKTSITIQDSGASPFGEWINKAAEEFEKIHPDVRVKHATIPFAQVLSTVLQQSLTETLPEIVWADNPWVPQLIKAGVYKDITDKVKEWGWENWEDFYKGHREVTSYKGRIYALQHTTNNLALFYRRSLLEKGGIENPPTTWQELLETCKVIKEKLGIYGIGFCAAASEEGTWQLEPFIWTNGGSLLELDQPEAIQALKLWTELVKKGYAPRDVVTAEGQGDVTMWFVNGEVAMMVNGNWEFGWHLTPDVRKRLGDVEVAPLPVPKEGMKPIVPIGGECYGIASTVEPEKFDITWEFLKKLFSPEELFEVNITMEGGLPTRASLAERALEAKPMLKPFLEQAKYALPRPPVGGMEKYPEVSAEVWTAIQKAITGALTPEEAFKEASQKIEKLFTPEEYGHYKQLARKLLAEARD